jgi:N-acetylmuramoyl-L-alanine amidase
MATTTTNPDMAAGTLPPGTGKGASPWPREQKPTDVAGALDNDLDRKPSHRDALQALLAFSALHEQVRRRKSLAARSNAFDTVGPEREFEAGEQFVLDEVLELVAERAVAITGADGLAIALAENNEIVLRASAGAVRPDVGARIDRSSAFSGACFRMAQIVRCDDTELDPRVNLRACRRLGARSMVAVPLCGRRRVIGLLEAFSAEPFGVNDSDVRNLSLLAELVLGALKPEDEDRFAESAQAAEKDLESGPSPQTELSSEKFVARVPRALIEPAIAETVASPAPIEIAEPSAPTTSLFSKPPVEPNKPELDKLHEPEEATEAVAAPVPATHRPGVLLVLASVVVASLLGAGLWWKLKNSQLGSSIIETQKPASKSGSAAGVTPTTKPATPPGPAPIAPGTGASAGTSASQDVLSGMGATQNSAATPQELSKFPRVTGIRHWSSADSTTVVLDLEDQVQYEAHRLSRPDRIYFDLRDTALSEEMAGKTVEVGDTLLNRIRVAQPVPGMTRVVLETKGNSNFAVSLEPNPYRLVVQVSKIGAGPRSAVNLFPNAVEAENRLAIIVPPPTKEDLQLRARVPRMRIVVDAGHGGWDLGTVGRRGLLEKDLVLEIAQRLGKLLESRLGSEIIYTRQDDNYVPLDERAGIANQAQADLFVSVHANYSDLPSARGVETYYTNFFSAPSTNNVEARENGSASKPAVTAALSPVELHEKVEQSRRLAASVQRSLYGILSVQNPGLRDRGIKEASFVVLTETSMPGILAEVSFVSSPTDEQRLRSDGYREQIAEALYKGIARYAANTHAVKVASMAK